MVDGFIVDDLGFYGDVFNFEEDGEDEFLYFEDFLDFFIFYDFNVCFDKYFFLVFCFVNIIFFIGLMGLGKIVVVYVVVYELGWEVFEVYVGMGKWIVVNLMKWVGELGKNYIVFL